jgi:hypothetical protein
LNTAQVAIGSSYSHMVFITTEVQLLIEVEVDLYSGRPNPRFALTPDAAAELERRLSALPTLGPKGTLREGLGYRGLRITGDPMFVEVLISAGVVETRDRQGAVIHKADHERKLERWLIEAGSAKLTQEELGILRQDLAQ